MCLPIYLDYLLGTCTGYKLNIQKTQILMLNYTPSPELRQRIPIDWSQKAIKYLCLAVPVIYIRKEGIKL